MNLTLKGIVDFLLEHLVQIAIESGVAIAGIIWQRATIKRFVMRQWRRLQFCRIWLSYKLLSRFRRVTFSLATLDDYVDLLEELRERLVDRCELDPDLVIRFYVFTTQLPHDWPLWNLAVTENTREKTRLWEYATNLKTFLDNRQVVDLKRIIIIENSDRPPGRTTLEMLRDDVGKVDCFKEYIEMLHKNEDQAFYCLYDRPWPTWLSDVVLYGVRHTATDKSEWLWAVTTTYRPGSDIMSLRFHRMGERPMSKKYTFPWSYRDFVTLANKTTTLQNQGTIRKLTGLRSSASNPPRVDPPKLPGPPTGCDPKSDGAQAKLKSQGRDSVKVKSGRK